MIFSIPLYEGPQRSFLKQLRNRLRLSLSLLALCVLLSASLGIVVSFRQQQIGEQKVLIHDTESTLFQAMLDQETGLRGYITTANTSFLAPYTSGQTQYQTSLRQLQAAINTPGFSATTTALKSFEDRATAWSTDYANIQIANIRSGQLATARADATVTQGKTLFDAVRAAFSNVQQSSDSELAASQLTTTIIDLSALGVALLLTILAIVWLWRTFRLFTQIQRQHLDYIKDASIAFGNGDLAARVQQGADSEFNEVGEVFNAMAATLKEQQQGLKDRDILEHVSLLNALLTESLDMNTLIDSFFQRITGVLDIQIAALYLYQPASQQLTHFASRGIPQAVTQTSIAMGEGLVGRAAQEREQLMVGQQGQPDAQFQIHTIIGAALPASLYHLPLIHGNQLLGVLVVGSLYPMKEQSRNVLNVVVSNLSSAIHNTQSYEQIQQQALELTERSRQQEESNKALRQQRDELSVLNEALEEANRVRSQFLSTMSHELRTPLTSIIGFTQMLQRSISQNPLMERQQQNIERILRNAQHLLSLINDVLDLTKIEAGHMDISTREINLQELLTSVVEETRSIAISRGLDLRLEIPKGLPVIETDERKVRQIVLNLLSNALKFTEKGFVQVTATSQETPADGNETNKQIIITVQDTGIGIPPETQEHIFDAFYQVDNSNSRNYGGTGLGLSIVNELTTLLGGKIEFESQPDQGSIFRLILPQRAREQRLLQDFRLHAPQRIATGQLNQPQEARTLPSAVAMLQLHEGEEGAPLIMAVDDNPDVLQLIAHALEYTPYRVVGIQDSSQALQAIQDLKPDVITLDIMMPRVNGWQILHTLKSNPATAAIPVIMLTVLEDRSAGYVLGADEYLVKPVAHDTLLGVLQQLLTSRPHTPVASEDQKSMPEATQNTIVVESNNLSKPIALLHTEHNIPALLERLINEAGYSVQNTPPDQDAIALIEQKRPDLLMLLI